MNRRRTLAAVETTIVWLFLLQALRVLYSRLFGIFYDGVHDQSLPVSIVALNALLIILASLTPLLLRRFEGQTMPRLAAVLLVLAARIPLSLAEPTLQLYASILLLAGAAYYIADILLHQPTRLMTGFVAGLGADQLLRALDFTYDPTLRPSGLLLVIGLTLITAVISLYLAQESVQTTRDQSPPIVGIALGAGLFVELSLLALPNAVSRWSGSSYAWLAPSLLLVTLLPLVPAARAVEFYLLTLFWPLGGIISAFLTIVCFALAAFIGGVASAVLLLIAQLVFMFSFTTGVSQRRTRLGKESPRPGSGVSLGFLLLLLLSMAFAFTFTYPYTLPFFRGLGTPVLLIGLLVALLPAVNIPLEPEIRPVSRPASALATSAIGILTVICAAFVRPSNPADTTADGILRLATYNIHFGFDGDWVYSLEKIAETIEANAVDVALLQEVDAARVTSLSIDNALWLSQRLGMYVVFQPTLEKLSGIALLSRYPLETSTGQELTSTQEQMAIVHATLPTANGPLDIYGVRLGLRPDEQEAQLAEVLDYIGFLKPTALAGDFNATPESPVYAHLTAAGLQDPFISIGSDPTATSPAINPSERIDYVWLWGLTPTDAWVSDSTASDHRLVVVEIQPNPMK